MQIKFLISSHISYFEKTINKIIPSLLKSGIDPDLIYMVIMQGDKNGKLINNYGIHLYKVNQNSFDAHSAFLSIFELDLVSDYWFFLHDTCIVEEKFYQKIKEFDYSMDYDVICACNRDNTMNLAMYKHCYLKLFEPTLRKEKNIDFSLEKMKFLKREAIYKENMFSTKPKMLYYKDIFMIDVDKIKITSYSNPKDKNPAPLEICDFYGTGTPRLKVYFEDLGIYKYSANYGQIPHESLDHVIKL